MTRALHLHAGQEQYAEQEVPVHLANVKWDSMVIRTQDAGQNVLQILTVRHRGRVYAHDAAIHARELAVLVPNAKLLITYHYARAQVEPEEMLSKDVKLLLQVVFTFHYYYHTIFMPLRKFHAMSLYCIHANAMVYLIKNNMKNNYLLFIQRYLRYVTFSISKTNFNFSHFTGSVPPANVYRVIYKKKLLYLLKIT
jgi:hypothetical protein